MLQFGCGVWRNDSALWLFTDRGETLKRSLVTVLIYTAHRVSPFRRSAAINLSLRLRWEVVSGSRRQMMVKFGGRAAR